MGHPRFWLCLCMGHPAHSALPRHSPDGGAVSWVAVSNQLESNMKSSATRKIFCLALAFSGLALKSAAQTQASSTTPQPAPQLFSRQVKKTIAIIYTTCEGDSQTYEGTGFFVMKEDSRLGIDKGFGYLVTNRHVVLPHVEIGQPCKVATQFVRLNSKTPDPKTGGRNAVFKVDSQWTYPEDNSVDLAVIAFVPDQTKYDVQAFPVSLFATKDVMEKENVAEGDPVLYTGFFYQFPGSLEIEPIIRQGIIAMIPNEPIPTTLGGSGKGYLADAHVYSGNSGSPMFVNVGGARNGILMTGTRYLFLGVVSGLEPEETTGELRPVTTYSDQVKSNSGVSFIVPADLVADLLNCPALSSQRDDAIKKMGVLPK
jgi:S1-C subfamily serine protease